jgi:hypothetical protein
VKDAQLLQYAANLFAVWTGTQGVRPDIGLSEEQVASLGIALTAAQTAKSNQVAAASASKSAGTGKRTKFKALRTKLAGLTDIVEGFAKETGDPTVYQRAHIDPPAPPAPRSEAAQPENVDTLVRTDGSILVTFEVTSGGSATFDIQRQAVLLSGEEGPWTSLDTVGKKEYLDEAVPVGLRRVLYRVRTTLTNGVSSEWSEPSVANFGNQGSMGGPAAAKASDSDAA